MTTHNCIFADERLSRRTFLTKTAHGVGKIALASLLNPALFSAAVAAASKPAPNNKWAGVVNPLHYPAKAKRVIWLSMAGGPSHLETFDYKPKLAEMHGQPMPESFTAGKQIAQLQGKELRCFAPQHKFARFGKNQVEICELFPHIGSVIDDICLMRSMTTETINHDPAHMIMKTD